MSPVFCSFFPRGFYYWKVRKQICLTFFSPLSFFIYFTKQDLQRSTYKKISLAEYYPVPEILLEFCCKNNLIFLIYSGDGSLCFSKKHIHENVNKHGPKKWWIKSNNMKFFFLNQLKSHKRLRKENHYQNFRVLLIYKICWFLYFLNKGNFTMDSCVGLAYWDSYIGIDVLIRYLSRNAN